MGQKPVTKLRAMSRHNCVINCCFSTPPSANARKFFFTNDVRLALAMVYQV